MKNTQLISHGNFCKSANLKETHNSQIQNYLPKLVACFVLTWLAILQHTAPAHAAQIEIIDGVVPGQKLITITGEIVEGDDEAFYRLAQQAERASVFMESPGGIVDVGLSIGAEISIRGFTTLVLDGAGCHSICAVMWVSGVRRYMSPNANISVHAAYELVGRADGSVELPESGVANASIGAYLNQLGLSLDAIRYFTTAKPGNPLLPITPEIAQRLDIDVFIQDGSEVTTPDDRPTPQRITRQSNGFVGMAVNCTELLGVDAGYWQTQAKGVLQQGHDTFGGEVFAPLIAASIGVEKRELAELGTVRWCITTEAKLRNDSLSTGVSGPSFDCNLAATSTELAICGSPDLWTLDRAMASIYFHYRAASNGQQATEFLNGQRQWLQRRDECAGDTMCLVERYSSRLFDFGY